MIGHIIININIGYAVDIDKSEFDYLENRFNFQIGIT